jgi:para-nitrobenzyl esterase
VKHEGFEDYASLTNVIRAGRTYQPDPAAHESYQKYQAVYDALYGATKDLVFMQGCTKDEFNYFVWCLGEDGCIKWSEGVLEKKMAQLTDEERSLVQGFCDDVKGERFESVTRICDQYWFNAPCIRTAELQSEAGGTTYNYYFRAESSVPQMRSGHAIELSSVFNHPEEILVTGHAFDETFAKTIRQMWVRFATCGDPSLPADVSPTGREIAWPAYDLKDKSVMVFDEFDVHVEAEEDLGIVDRERSYFLTKYYIL